MKAKAHPGTIISIVGVIVLLIGLAVQSNAPILIGFFAAIGGAILNESRKTTHHDTD